jgi:hypothetical protein
MLFIHLSRTDKASQAVSPLANSTFRKSRQASISTYSSRRMVAIAAFSSGPVDLGQKVGVILVQ